MFYSVETKRLLIWKCQRHYLIITRIITSKWDNFSKSDKNLSTFVSTLANFWKFFVRNTSSALYHFSYFSRIDYFSTCPEENSRRCMASDRPWFTLPLSPTLIFFCIAPLFPHLEPSLIIFPSYSKVWPKKWEFLQTSWRPVKITIPLLWLWVGKLELTMLFWQRAFSSVCNYTAYAIKFFL